MVRELPSTLISLSSAGLGWRVQCGADLFDGFTEDAARVWGDDYEALTRPLPDISLKEQYFPTRFAALSALESALSPCNPSTLSGVLS